MKRKASIATAAVFLAVLFGFSLLHLALPDREVSRSERPAAGAASSPVFRLFGQA